MLEIILNYLIVLLALLLLIGALNAYYFLDFILQKENREKLYKVWVLTFLALLVHTSAHVLESMVGESILAVTLETASLTLGFISILILAKATLKYYSFVEMKNRLEAEVTERTKEIEEYNLALKRENEERHLVTNELIKKIDELEKWQRVTVGREVRMAEIKKEVEKLKSQLEKYEKK